jgi:hypothetical protein
VGYPHKSKWGVGYPHKSKWGVGYPHKSKWGVGYPHREHDSINNLRIIRLYRDDKVMLGGREDQEDGGSDVCGA